ncbi:palmitoyltransferase PFA4 Ecym_3032 [Eremothecium cymbalariae DBVPG|uniref:Palmitoyltransferase PFA4 n=1 Tax=Eremothecium cymbalariae (strain CBS 270.75 / DBVPG 7215 / KCTC 17166 / NRRL Y-17582) TaxID=931890 RepID=G8JQX8_ERECY|nr:Hypothetical protein Ecym_3032 [Eremothecium cymbalariae DBVPG\
MPVKLKWPWLGIAIPCFLIAFIGYSAQLFVLQGFLSVKQQIWFQFSLTMIWLSYYKAIYTNPGSPVPGFQPLKHEWKNYCKKCQNFKPERTHHCKTCAQCVLVMDHHCPFTMNCVGYNNFPHFMRFLFWIITTTTYLSIQFFKRTWFVWNIRHSTAQLVTKKEIIFLTILTPANAFVLLTISILFGRCIKNQVLNGMTQIEAWEMDRIESMFYNRRLVPQLLSNLEELYPNSLDGHKGEIDRILNNRKISFEDLVNFPYDSDPWRNLINCMGPMLTWLNPFGKPNGNGMVFEKNELSAYEHGSTLTDKLLSLPWPPDGERAPNSSNSRLKVESSTRNGEHIIRKRSPEPRLNLSRTEWYNDWGENLAHFGVDVDADD